MDKREMLLNLITVYAGGNKARFADMVGISRQALSQWVRRGMFDPEPIYAACPGVSARWLLSGEGGMTEVADPMAVTTALIDRIQYLSAELERLKK